MKISVVENSHLEVHQMEIDRFVWKKNYLGRNAARISIAILALGFSMLGLLSIINRHPTCTETNLSLENALSIVGGTASFMLGGIFLIAGSFHWSRSFPAN
jgi:hypothetical protein